jgi:hypothetical protein
MSFCITKIPRSAFFREKSGIIPNNNNNKVVNRTTKSNNYFEIKMPADENALLPQLKNFSYFVFCDAYGGGGCRCQQSTHMADRADKLGRLATLSRIEN